MKKVVLPEDSVELAKFLMARRAKGIETASKWQKEHRALSTERSKIWREKKKLKELKAAEEEEVSNL